MKDYKGAVFFDVDGTLVDERLKIYQPTEMTKQAIARLKENGYLVGIATGRSRCYTPKTDIDFDCYVTSNGAVAEVDGKEIHNDFISKEDLLNVPLLCSRQAISSRHTGNRFAENLHTRHAGNGHSKRRRKPFQHGGVSRLAAAEMIIKPGRQELRIQAIL